MGKQRPPGSYKLLPLLIAAMTVLALVIGATALSYVETRLVSVAGEGLALAASDLADKLDQALFQRYADVQVAATALSPHLHEPSVIQRYLKRTKEQYLMYSWLGVTDARGRILAATNPSDLGADRSTTAWYRALRQGQPVHMQDVQGSQGGGGRPFVEFAAPLRGPRGEFLGTVVAHVGLSELEDVFGRTVQAFQEQRHGGQLEWQLVRRDGMLIADSRLREEGRTNLRLAGLPSVSLPRAGQPGYIEEQHLRRNLPVVTGYATTRGHAEFTGFEWEVLLRLDRHDILAPIRTVLWKLGLAGAVAWLPMLVGLLWMTGRLRQEYGSAQERGDRLSTILRSIGDAVIVTDAGGCVAFMNPVAEALTGWSQQEACGQRLDAVFVIVNELTRQPVESPVDKVLREGTVVGLANHTILIARDGTERPIDDSGAPVRDETGALTGVVLVFRDISERKQAEAALRQSELRFSSVVESAADAIVVADGRGDILSWNGGAQRIFGYQEREIVGQPLTRLMPERFREAHSRGLERVRATGESRVLGTTLELVGQHKDGREFPIELSLGGWTMGSDTFFNGVIRDLTERKRSECRLAAQYAVTRALVQASSLEEAGPRLLQAVCESLEWDMGALWTVDRRANRLRCRDIWHGSSTALEEFKALTSRTAFPPGVGLPGRVWSSGQPAWIFDVVLDPNFPRAPVAKEERVHGAFGFPIRTRETVVGVLEFFSHKVRHPDRELLGMMDDMGLKIGQFVERTQLEDQLRHSQKLDAVGRLAGGVAHDFNNLLTVINGCSDMLLRRIGEAQPLRRYTVEIKQASERAAALTSQLLAFSRRQMLEPRVLNLNAQVTAMESMIRRLIGEHIDLEVIRGTDLGWIKADAGQVEQVIMNLAVNARDAMPEGGKLTIETSNVHLDADNATQHLSVEPGAYVMLAVSDTGQGMDQETQTRLFEPFFTTKEKGKGTGLGLSTVYGIVRQSGGTIWVYSEIGRGSTFKIYLPRVVDVLEAPAPVAATGLDFDRGSETVLVVEDEAAVRNLVAEALTEAGYRVVAASQGHQALELSRQHDGPIHLLLTDVVMPGMSGRVLAEQVLAQRPALQVLYMSGYTDNAIVHHGILDAGTQFLHKPFSREGLLRKVREVLEDRNA